MDTLNKPLFNKIRYKLTGMVSLKPTAAKRRGTVLLSYICKSFFYTDENLPLAHTNFWECREIARIFLELGYAVDVIDWQNKKFIPRKKYSAYIDIHDSIKRLTPYLPKDCVKIFHITGAHWLFCNTAEYLRLQQLKERRGFVIFPRRVTPPDLNPEHMDAATILGNAFTQDTYRYAKKPIFPIPISSTNEYPFPENKNIDEAKKHFVWFGGSGLVHKGLDLTLEAFAAMPEYTLTVIGPTKKEHDFSKIYHRELYETPNIRTVGWLETSSEEFKGIMNASSFLIYPTCSEGGGGSVITCMHAGLIPIVTYESSVDVEDFGMILRDISVEKIRQAVRNAASLPSEEVRSRSKKSWQFARAHHTREAFSDAYMSAVKKILKLD